MPSSSSSSSGVGFTGLLLVLFIALKLTGVIHWSWWWVLAPMWAPLALVVAACVVFGVGWIITDTLNARKARRRRW